MSDPTAIGFRAKTGWAAVVLLGGPAAAPRVLDSRRIDLCDPGEPDSRQPYHAGFGTFREDDAEVKRLVRGVRRYAARAIEKLMTEYAAAGHSPRRSAVVAGSDVDPAKIANLHMRAHALEGRLYRNLVEESMAAAGLSCSVLLERGLQAGAAEQLGLTEDRLKRAIGELGKRHGGPWRAEQKAAALAAWTVLPR
jgi:hypothetical protein